MGNFRWKIHDGKNQLSTENGDNFSLLHTIIVPEGETIVVLGPLFGKVRGHFLGYGQGHGGTVGGLVFSHCSAVRLLRLQAYVI